MSVSLATTFPELRRAVAQARGKGKSVELVPTMGALHAGHISLVETARKEAGFVVVSIFVNPTQFGPNEDFTRYPRPLQQDLNTCEHAGVDLVFMPELNEMYPTGFRTHVEVSGLQDTLEGAIRPGHFRGVATVVLKLFNQIQPDIAYFGQKDAQQAIVIRRMVRDLDVPVRLQICPIVREADGLALSSRNVYLSPDDRRHATVLFHALEKARHAIEKGERDAQVVRRLMADEIASAPRAFLDYAEVVDTDSLEPLNQIRGNVLIPLAVRFGTTRLIDNIMLNVTPQVARSATSHDG